MFCSPEGPGHPLIKYTLPSPAGGWGGTSGSLRCRYGVQLGWEEHREDRKQEVQVKFKVNYFPTSVLGVWMRPDPLLPPQAAAGITGREAAAGWLL